MRVPSADELLGGINRWVAVESKTSEVEGVNRMMDLAAEACAGVGMGCERIPGRGGFADCLLARAPDDGGDGACILTLAHLDTVHPNGTLAKNPIRTEGDRAFGPGTYDMKGGAFLSIAAYGAARSAGGPQLPVRLLFVSDEEVGSPVSRARIESEGERARHVLVVEPCRDGGKVVTGRKGTIRGRVAAHGRQSHSGTRPLDGRSAILEMAHQIVAIEAMTDYGRDITTNVGLVRGGTTVNTIPGYCEAEIDVRIARAADAEEMLARLRSLRPRDPDVRLEIDARAGRPPFERTEPVAALFEHARREAKALGVDLVDGFTGGGSDGNFTAAKGIATLDGLGVDGAGAHTLEEHLLVSSLEPRTALLARLFLSLR